MSAEYKIELSPPSQRQLKKLPKKLQQTIIQKLDLLKTSPMPLGIKKLAGLNDVYRLRIGDYRVIYQIEHKILLILVLKIGDRKEVYNNLQSLLTYPSNK